jgi:hypothetical protein
LSERDKDTYKQERRGIQKQQGRESAKEKKDGEFYLWGQGERKHVLDGRRG